MYIKRKRIRESDIQVLVGEVLSKKQIKSEKRSLRMDDMLALLKKAATAVPFLKFEDLEIGREYVIERFELLNDTKFGACIVVYIDGDMLYLPKRFVKILKADIDNLNKKNHVLIYGGKDIANSNRIIIDFELVKEDPAEKK